MQKLHMKREGPHLDPRIPSSRVGTLLREREKRKFFRSSTLSQDINTGDSDQSSEDVCNYQGDTAACSQTEELLESESEVKNCSNQIVTKRTCSEKQRLLVVANRLPISATKEDDGTWKLEVGVGGLATALVGLKEFEARWIGWAGINIPDEAGQKELTKAMAEKASHHLFDFKSRRILHLTSCIPIFLDEETFNQYYNSYCNNILWPLFHYLGLPQEDRLTTPQIFQSQFNAYKRANQMFADVVSQHYKDGDIVWCHDYHLMYLPKCLKGYDNNIKIGWFLHTPFPSSEIHRLLSSRSELLRSVLEADIVGFHTYDYARHFVSSCTSILGPESTPDGVEHQGKLTRVVAYPVGIDFERFVCAFEVPEVQDHIIYLKRCFAGRKENIDWRDKVVLVQIAVPSRSDVPKYQKLASQVHEIVGRINGRFGTLTALPIHHLDCSLNFHALCSLYAITDVALITSLRDGMNLYEFVACQASKKGVLILSEFAGAAQSLGAGAILVNPWNIMEVANAISYAFNMPADEREKRHQYNYNYVMSHTSQEWAEISVENNSNPTFSTAELAIRKFVQSDNRLLILGLNATLTQSVETPEERVDQIKDMELKLRPEIKEPLRRLCNDPKTTVLILSGSTRINFDEFDIWLAAENGMFLRHTTGEWMTALPECSNMEEFLMRVAASMESVSMLTQAKLIRHNPIIRDPRENVGARSDMKTRFSLILIIFCDWLFYKLEFISSRVFFTVLSRDVLFEPWGLALNTPCLSW
ncbi:hypothetical protein V2J09_006529 [Rumex salicifolius]